MLLPANSHTNDTTSCLLSQNFPAALFSCVQCIVGLWEKLFITTKCNTHTISQAYFSEEIFQHHFLFVVVLQQNELGCCVEQIRPSGGINTQSLVRFGSDPEPLTDRRRAQRLLF